MFRPLDKSLIPYINIILTRNKPVDFILNEKPYQFIVESFSCNLTPSTVLRFKLNDEDAVMFIANSDLNILMQEFTGDVLPIYIDDELKKVILSVLMETIVNQMIRNKIKISDIDFADISSDNISPNFCFKLTDEKTEIICGLFLSSSNLKAIAKLYQNIEPVSNYDFECIDCMLLIMLDVLQLTAQEVKSLCSNDILVLNNSDYIKQDKIYIKTPFKTYDGIKQGNQITINNMLEATVSLDVNSIDNIDQLPVKLEFIIGKKKLLFGELKILQKGYTFELDAKLDQPVEIVANGKSIAKGEIVRLDDRIGVRVLELLVNAR